jgi:hypothetical protein
MPVRRSYDLFDVGVSENEDSAACCNSDRRFPPDIAPWPCQQEFAKIRMGDVYCCINQHTHDWHLQFICKYMH